MNPLPQEPENIAASNENNKDALLNTSTFDLFPKLPLELRRIIWKHALPGPRYVEVRTAEPSGIMVMYNYSDDEYRNHMYFACIENAPALFFACQEARTEVEKFYYPFTGTKVGARAVWLDPHIDILVFRYAFFHAEIGLFLLHLPRFMREKVASISLDNAVVQTQWADITSDLTSLLPGLQQIYLTCDLQCAVKMTSSKKAIVGLTVMHQETDNLQFSLRDGYKDMQKWFLEAQKGVPGWRTPVLHFGDYVTGSAYESSSVTVVEPDD